MPSPSVKLGMSFKGDLSMMGTGRKPAGHSDLDCILLCLAHIYKDSSGYQLRSLINESTGYYYQAHLSQIYPALHRLAEEGLLVCREVERDGKPDLKLYQITRKGLDVAHKWLVEPPEFGRTRASADQYFLKFPLMGHMDPKDVEAYIDYGIASLNEQRERVLERDFEEDIDAISTDDPEVRERYEAFWQGKVDMALSDIDCRLNWLQTTKERFC